MLRLLQSIGFSVVCATPHQKDGFFLPSAATIAERHEQVRAILSGAGLKLPLYLAAENYWDELFLGRAKAGEQPMYRQVPEASAARGDSPAASPADSPAASPAGPAVAMSTGFPAASPAGFRSAAGPAPARVFLFELPVEQLPPRPGAAALLHAPAGLSPRSWPTPERYAPLWGKRDRIEALSRCAALVIDLAALDGAHGPERAKAARYLVQEGLCHAAASDVHQPSDVRAVASGINWIRKKCGTPRLEALLSEGPRQILAGELPDLPA